mgnify:CR=1 FL=1
MFPSFIRINRTSLKKASQGSALVLAIFIMVVMLMLGAALVKVLSSGNNTLAYEVVGTRAFNAANAGVQIQLSALFPLNSPAQTCASAPVGLPNFTTTNGLQNCRISSLTCTDFSEDDITYFTIRSTGECDMESNELITVTSRTVEVEARTL